LKNKRSVLSTVDFEFFPTVAVIIGRRLIASEAVEVRRKGVEEVNRNQAF
jgi:hypothetical protein